MNPFSFLNKNTNENKTSILAFQFPLYDFTHPTSTFIPYLRMAKHAQLQRQCTMKI